MTASAAQHNLLRNALLVVMVSTAVKPLLSSGWHELTDRYSEITLSVWGSWWLGVTVHWTFSGVLAYLELSRDKWLQDRKLQPGKYITTEDYKRAAVVALRNQVLVNIPVGYLFYYLSKARGWQLERELPTCSQMMQHFAVFVVMEEIGFYFVHRAMHTKLLYAAVHKIHHEFKAPVGMAATYSHWLEHLLCNLTPLLLGPFVTGAHLVTIWLWITLALVNAINTHSGYQLPVLGSAQGHDDHHRLTYGNYGVTGFFDTLFGTKLKQPEPRRAATKAATEAETTHTQ